MFIILVFAQLVFAQLVSADDPSKIIATLKTAGATVKRYQQDLEIDFHLKGRNTARQSLKLVGQLNNVVWLNLADTNVTDESLVHLKNLKRLRSLHLEKTNIGNEGISHLIGLNKLEYLNLYSTNVTDASLARLAKITSLQKLYIWQTKTTDKGVKRLALASPQLKIVRGLNLNRLPSKFPSEESEPKPKVTLDWVAVARRDEAPAKSDNGVNCQVWFENSSEAAVKLYWISYGSGELKFYATLKPKQLRRQNSYARNSWLITDLADRPLGYFIVKDDNARAIIPKIRN